MDFKHHLENAWNTTLKHIVILIIMTLVVLVVSFFTLGILAPVVFAGYTQAIIYLMRDAREPRIDDLFSQMRLFLPLFIFFIIVTIASLIGFSLFVLPGLAIMAALTFGCIYMLPLMTDQKMDIMTAAKTSWDMAFKDGVADHIVVVILYIGLVSIGSSVFIGVLFTMPFATVFLVSAYLEKMTDRQDIAASAPPPPPADSQAEPSAQDKNGSI